MKAIFGVLFGYALMFVIVGTALAEGSPRATANATSRSQGSADIQDGKALQGQTKSSAEVTADENASASLDAIRDRARQVWKASLTSVGFMAFGLSKIILAKASVLFWVDNQRAQTRLIGANSNFRNLGRHA